MKELKLKIDNDELVILSILSSYLILSFQYFLITCFTFSNPSLTKLVQLGSKVLVGIIYLISLPTIMRKNILSLYFSYSILLIFVSLNLLFYPGNRIYIKNELFYIFFVTIISFVYSYNIENSEKFYKGIEKISKLVLLIGVITAIFIILKDTGYNSMEIDQKYSMSFSYNLLMPLLVNVNEFVKKMKLLAFIKFVISLFIITILGARGPILCLIIFLLLRFIKIDLEFNTKSIVVYSSLIIFLVILLINFQSILFYLYNFSKYKIGFESRTLYKMLFVDGVEFTGRKEIYRSMLEVIKKNPLLGVGFLGDRNYFIPYPHNIFIEILTQGGVFIGGLVSLFIIYMIIKSLINAVGIDYDLLIFWISMGIGPLLVSNTYVEFIGFWILLGQLLRFKKEPKNGENYER